MKFKRRQAAQLALAGGALALLLSVFGLYLRPDLALTLANHLWNCF